MKNRNKVDIEKMEKIYEKSIEVLRSVQLKNGGCLATPKGERYPYIYPRDHSIATIAFLSAGLINEAKKALEFVYNYQLKTGAFPQRYDVYGRDASYKPVQIDGTALILYSLAKYVEKTNDYDFLKQILKKIKNAITYIEKNIEEKRGLVYTPNSIHEFPPMEQGLEIWANSTCYGALLGLSKVVKRNTYLIKKLSKDVINWENIARKIKKGILKYMWNNRIKSFIKTIRLRESSSVVVNADASMLGLAEFKVISDSDKRMRLTVKRIEKELWNKEIGGLCRYPKYEGRNNGGWGPWPHFTLMLCRHYIRLKNRKKADMCLNWVANIAYNYELPEHISTKREFEEYVMDFKQAGLLRKDRLIMIKNARKHPMFKKGLAYITLPLAWPHAEFILTWNLYKKFFNIKPSY